MYVQVLNSVFFYTSKGKIPCDKCAEDLRYHIIHPSKSSKKLTMPQSSDTPSECKSCPCLDSDSIELQISIMISPRLQERLCLYQGQAIDQLFLFFFLTTLGSSEFL